MSQNIWKVLFESAKEPLRIFVLAIIPTIISYLSTSGFDPLIVSIGTVILRFIDKFLYEMGKANGNTVLEGGLTRF